MSNLSQNESKDDVEKTSEGEIVEVRQEDVLNSGFGHRAKRHCAKWWWLHLVIFCVGFLVVSLCLVYVAMPKIAQHGVNQSSLEMLSIAFLDPTPDSVTLTMNAILYSPSIFTPTLDPFNATLWLVTNGSVSTVPMNQLLMPQIHALHPKSIASVSLQTVAIENLDQITDYAIQVMTGESVSTALTGRTKLHEGHLPASEINFNTTVTYEALNGLAGFNVTQSKVNLTAPVGEPNLSGLAYIPNKSAFTIAMGNVTLSLTSGTADIGIATIQDLTIKPGDNYLPMTAVVNQTEILNHMDTEGFLDMTITGQTSVYNGQHITYYEKALSSSVLHLKMNIKQILADSV